MSNKKIWQDQLSRTQKELDSGTSSAQESFSILNNETFYVRNANGTMKLRTEGFGLSLGTLFAHPQFNNVDQYVSAYTNTSMSFIDAMEMSVYVGTVFMSYDSDGNNPKIHEVIGYTNDAPNGVNFTPGLDGNVIPIYDPETNAGGSVQFYTKVENIGYLKIRKG